MRKLILLASLLALSTAHAAKWEYAILFAAQNYYEWQSPSGNISTDDLKTTMAKMGCKTSPSKSANYIDLLNCVGPLGWELIQVVPDGESERYMFKRQK